MSTGGTDDFLRLEQAYEQLIADTRARYESQFASRPETRPADRGACVAECLAIWDHVERVSGDRAVGMCAAAGLAEAWSQDIEAAKDIVAQVDLERTVRG